MDVLNREVDSWKYEQEMSLEDNGIQLYVVRIKKIHAVLTKAYFALS